MFSRCSVAALLLTGLCGCARADSERAGVSSAVEGLRRSTAVATGTFAHGETAFTQGFAFWRGRLYEGTGLYGQSIIREIDPRNGKELRRVTLGKRYFGEGVTILDGRIYQLTWQEKVCFVYDAETLERIGELPYDGEGWGLTNDGRQLIMSDGSDSIDFRSPSTFAIERTIRVTEDGRPVRNLNELELIRGEIWANVWQTDRILRIAPSDGRVVAVIDAAPLVRAASRSRSQEDVLNGIAYDDQTNRILVTGKRWPLVFEIKAPDVVDPRPAR